MKFCTKCGNKLAEGQRFCTKCGAPNKPAQAQPAPVIEAPAAAVPEPVAAPEPIVEPDPMEVLFPQAAAVIPEPAPAPVPTPTPAPTREYSNILPMILALGNAGVIDDIVDEPAGMSQEAVTAWSKDKLAALSHRSGGSEYQIVIADGALNPSGYPALVVTGDGVASAHFGTWVVSVALASGATNESARVLQKVLSLL
jgi:hypothetical protein